MCCCSVDAVFIDGQDKQHGDSTTGFVWSFVVGILGTTDCCEMRRDVYSNGAGVTTMMILLISTLSVDNVECLRLGHRARVEATPPATGGTPKSGAEAAKGGKTGTGDFMSTLFAGMNVATEELKGYGTQRMGCCCQPAFGAVSGGEPCTDFPDVLEFDGKKRPPLWPYMSALESTYWCPFSPSVPAVFPDESLDVAKAAAAEGSDAAKTGAEAAKTGAEAAKAGAETAKTAEPAVFVQISETPAPDTGAEAAKATGSEATTAPGDKNTNSTGSEAVAKAAEKIVDKTMASIDEASSTPTCRFFPGLLPGSSGNCMETCASLLSAFEMQQEQIKRLKVVRKMDRDYDMMLAMNKKKPGASVAKGASTAKTATPTVRFSQVGIGV